MRVHRSSANQLLTDAARHLIDAQRARLPFLNHVVVLLPTLYARRGVERALNAAAGGKTLIAPRITNLRDWASEVALPQPVVADSRRQAMLYRALREKAWFPDADLWAICADFIAVFDELTRCGAGLPSSQAELEAALVAGYRARSSQASHFEAVVANELARALTIGGLDTESAYAMRLAYLAAHAEAPLYALQLPAPDPIERRFFERYAQRAPVEWFSPRYENDASTEAGEKFLCEVWNDGGEVSIEAASPDDRSEKATADLRARALAFRAAEPNSPWAERFHIFCATSLTEEARVAELTIRAWLAAGCKTIAVVAQDRVVARRLRALLERAEIAVADEAGWTLSTTSASTVVMTWLSALANDFPLGDLFVLLKSPLIFRDAPRASYRDAVDRLERAIHANNIVAGLPRYQALAAKLGDRELQKILERVQAAARFLKRPAQPLHRWLGDLLRSLQALGVAQGLASDRAGEQVLQRLSDLRDELIDDACRFDFAEARSFLARTFETAVFRDPGIVSPVVFTQLPLTRARGFDALLLLGCDAAHLPGSSTVSRFFNRAVRAQLGLAPPAVASRQLRNDLIGAIAQSRETFVTWRKGSADEPTLLSPHFERLRAFHSLAYGDDLADRRFRRALASNRIRTPFYRDHRCLPVARPAPACSPGLIPTSISASGYNSLLACPYQFFASKVLGLRELDEADVDLEKKDYGEAVHEILRRFHVRHPVISAADPVEIELELKTISAEVFAPAIADNHLNQGWLWRWLETVAAYLDWQRQHEAQGWRYQDAETSLETEIPIGDEFSLKLRGRVDRIDARGAELSVLDYKAKSADKLKESLAEAGEDAQLPFYALQLGESCVRASYLGVDKTVFEIAADGGLREMVVDNRARLRQMFAQMTSGAPLPAHGINEVCGWCAMRGLCRKDHWHDST